MPPDNDDEPKKKTPRNPAIDDDDDDDDKPMTAKQVNAAITKAVKGVEKRVTKGFADTLKTTLTEAGVIKAPKTGDEEEEEEEVETPAKTPAAQQPAKATGRTKAEKELAKVKADMEKLTRERDAEKAAAARAELKTLTTSALTALNVRKEAIPLLVTHLMSEDGGQRVRRDDDGSPVFVDDDGNAVSLKDGFTAWAKTDEGKAYIAPRTVQGGPNGNGGGPARLPGQGLGRANGNPPGRGGADAVSQQNNELFNAVMGDMAGVVFGMNGDGEG